MFQGWSKKQPTKQAWKVMQKKMIAFSGLWSLMKDLLRVTLKLQEKDFQVFCFTLSKAFCDFFGSTLTPCVTLMTHSILKYSACDYRYGGAVHLCLLVDTVGIWLFSIPKYCTQCQSALKQEIMWFTILEIKLLRTKITSQSFLKMWDFFWGFSIKTDAVCYSL